MNGETVKALRLYFGMTQEEFAKKIGVSRHSISDIERGITPVSLRVKMRIAQHFEVDQNFLEVLEKTKGLGSANE